MNIKKILSCILAIFMCLSVFAACDGNDEHNSDTSATTEKITEASETESESQTGTDVSGERFDYFSADISEYATLENYKNINVVLDTKYIVNDEAVANYIAYLREYYPKTIKVTDRAVKDGDTVYLYFDGYIDGVAFKGGSNMTDTKPTELVIGSNRFIPGFEDALIGIVPSDTGRDKLVDLNLTFPESYDNAELAGKDVVFKVYIEYIAEYETSEYTEEFITDTLGFTVQGDDIFAEFEAYVKTILDNNQDTEIKNQVWNAVISSINVTKYPEGELEYYYNSYLNQYEYYRSYYSYLGYSFETLDEFVTAYLGLEEGTDWKAYTEEQCKLGIKQNLAFHYIGQKENMKITDTDYQNAHQYYVDYYTASGYSYTAEELENLLGTDMIKEQALFDKVTSLLMENVSVTYKETETEQ